MDEIRLIIAGGRDFSDYTLLENEADKLIDALHEKYPGVRLVIISGAARGTDFFGERYAREHRYSVKRFHAKWDLYGKQAGFIRNREMLDYAREKTGVLLSFWDGFSRGTRDMIEISRKAKIEVHVIRYDW